MRKKELPLNREEIEQCIPHRDPFLWVDEVIELSEIGIRVRKFLDPALGVFVGHYPNFPVLPGVLQCEAAFQAGAILLSKLGVIAAGKIPVVTRQNNTKFRHMVRPGDTLDIEVVLTEQLANAYFLTGKVSVDGKTSARLEFACTTTDAATRRS